MDKINKVNSFFLFSFELYFDYLYFSEFNEILSYNFNIK